MGAFAVRRMWGRGFHSASVALFAAMTTPPSAQRKILINECIRALDDSGIWAVLDFLYLFAAADSQAALLNWKNPGTFNATAVAAPTFTADRGFTTDSVSTCIDSNFNPSTAGGGFTQNSASFGIWNRTEGQQSGPIAGSETTATAALSILTRNTSDQFTWRVNNTTQDTNTNAVAVGLFVVARADSANDRGYKNGILQATKARASIAPANAKITFGKFNSTFRASEFAAGFAGADLTDANNATIYSALAGYMTAVGAA